MPNSNNYPIQQLVVQDIVLLRNEREILSNVSFGAKGGEVIILRGDNGVGKTSLLMAIAGYLHFETGTIDWQTKSAQIDKEKSPFVSNVHFIGHQWAIKPSLSLYENLSFWCNLYGGEQNQVQSALKTVGLSHAISHDGSQLSAGQSKRLSLARLLVANRAVWLLDEPTSSLDKLGDALVAKLIDNHLDRGGLAIIATHLDLSLRDNKRIKTLRLEAAK